MNDHAVARLAVVARLFATMLCRAIYFSFFRMTAENTKFGSEGGANVGGLCLGIYCRNCTTHFLTCFCVGLSQHLLQRLRLQFLQCCVSCRLHGGVLTLAVVDLD